MTIKIKKSFDSAQAMRRDGIPDLVIDHILGRSVEAVEGEMGTEVSCLGGRWVVAQECFQVCINNQYAL